MSLGKDLFMLGVGLYASLVGGRALAADYYTKGQMGGNRSLYSEVVGIGHGYEGTFGSIECLSISEAILNKSYVKSPDAESGLLELGGVGFNIPEIKNHRFMKKDVNGETRFYVVPFPEYLLKEADSDGNMRIHADEAEEDMNRRLEDIN